MGRAVPRARLFVVLVALLAFCGSARASARTAEHSGRAILEDALSGREEHVTHSGVATREGWSYDVPRSAVVAAALNVSPELVSVWSLVLHLTEEQACLATYMLRVQLYDTLLSYCAESVSTLQAVQIVRMDVVPAPGLPSTPFKQMENFASRTRWRTRIALTTQMQNQEPDPKPGTLTQMQGSATRRGDGRCGAPLRSQTPR